MTINILHSWSHPVYTTDDGYSVHVVTEVWVYAKKPENFQISTFVWANFPDGVSAEFMTIEEAIAAVKEG